MRWFDSIIYSVDKSLSKLQEIMKDRETWHAIDHGVTKNQQELTTEQQQPFILARRIQIKISSLGYDLIRSA